MSDSFPTNEKRLAQYRDRKAEEVVEGMLEEESERRQWCVECVLEAMNLEVTENNMIELCDKVYEYVWGKRTL